MKKTIIFSKNKNVQWLDLFVYALLSSVSVTKSFEQSNSA